MGDSENPKQDLKDTSPPPFSYSEIIVDPSALGSSPDAKNLTNNMNALTSYTDLLITSDSSANANPGHALGDQYFLKTSATCMLDGKSVPRYIYINHQPVSHNKKFVTTKKDMKFKELGKLFRENYDLDPSDPDKKFWDCVKIRFVHVDPEKSNFKKKIEKIEGLAIMAFIFENEHLPKLNSKNELVGMKNFNERLDGFVRKLEK